MRADTAFRAADVRNGFPAWSVGVGFCGFTGVVDVVRLGDSFEPGAADAFRVTLTATARLGCGVGAISMPKIPERS